MDGNTFDPFKNSVLVGKIADTGVINVLDLDGTSDGTEESRITTDTFARMGSALIHASARSEELLMSPVQYDLSVKRHGFSRPRSHKSLVNYRGQLDADAMCPFGGVPQLLQESGGYAPDLSYLALPGMDDWYWTLRRALQELDADFKIHNALSVLEDERNFDLGIADVQRLRFRIQLDFRGRRAYEEMCEIRERIYTSRLLFGRPRNFRMYDESNPAKERYTTYIVPLLASKGRCVDWLIRRAAKAAGRDVSSLSIRIAGDTFTDMSMLSCLPEVRDFRFLLEGASRLTPHFTFGNELFGAPFAGNRTRGIARRLRETNRNGIYRFLEPMNDTRTFVNGNLAYEGKAGSDSVKAFLEDTL